MPEVNLLKPGSIIRDEEGRILDARSSVSLIIAGGQRIVVDSGLSGEGERIAVALGELGLEPEDIDYIINTHDHPDHCGNNHLFSRARRLTPRGGEIIAPGVWVMATPGHSMDSISIVVEMVAGANCMADGMRATVVVIAGDALPTPGNFQKRVPPALHIDRALAVASMERIIRIADIVIPGHGHPFSIPEGSRVYLLPAIRNRGD